MLGKSLFEYESYFLYDKEWKYSSFLFLNDIKSLVTVFSSCAHCGVCCKVNPYHLPHDVMSNL